MNQEKIISGELETPVWSVRKKLVGLDYGLDVEKSLEKDEEDILIPFTVSLYVTSEKSKIALRRFINDLKNGVCRESLGINFCQMSKKDYWLGKCVKLKRDMEALGIVPMKAHGFECTVMGFKPETTVDLYHAIEANLIEIAELIGETDRLLMAAPLSLYGNFYRYQKSLCDPQPVAEAHGHWKRDVGSLTYDLLKDRQVYVVTEFLKKKILRLTLTPSEREVGEVNFEEIKKHLSKEYWDRLPNEFPKCCARFHRFVSWEDGILRLDHDQWGNYLFQFFHQLTPEERQAFIELDLMLELIHEDMRNLPTAEPETLPDPPCIGREQGHVHQANTQSQEERIRQCIALLMAERYGDETLFNIQGHWQAVYRILVDKGFCRDSDFNGFDAFIQEVMPEKVNKPYKRDSVRNINKTDFNKPFDKWKYNAETSGKRIPYDRMVAVASRFKSILEENGL